MDGDEQRRRQRQGDAVQHVEAQQRVFADEAAAQQQEAGIAARGDQLARRRSCKNREPGPS